MKKVELRSYNKDYLKHATSEINNFIEEGGYELVSVNIGSNTSNSDVVVSIVYEDNPYIVPIKGGKRLNG